MHSFLLKTISYLNKRKGQKGQLTLMGSLKKKNKLNKMFLTDIKYYTDGTRLSIFQIKKILIKAKKVIMHKGKQ